ncbi:MAG: hypothetical protein ACP5G7_06595 [Anaerolineae bacterium]
MAAVALLCVGLACTSSERPATPTPRPGTSRDNPVPFGTAAIVDDMAIMVGESVRPADRIVAANNVFYSEPAKGREYILVAVGVKCMKPADKTCRVGAINFKMVGSKGIISDPDTLVMAGSLSDDALMGEFGLGTEFFGEAITGGIVVFQVDCDDSGLLLIYEPFLGTRKTYMALE